MKKYLLLLLSILLGACSSQVVRVTSDPAGAHIEVNGNYVGQTPLSTEVRKEEDLKFVANPQRDGFCKQEAFYSKESKPPPNIFFSMRCEPRGTASEPVGIPSSPPVHNFNIQNNNDAQTNIHK